MPENNVSENSLIKRVNPTSWIDFVQLGVEARSMKDRSQWVLGDLAIQVEKGYGKDAIGEYAKEVDVNKNSLVTYRTVSKAWLPKDRDYQLSHRHHMVIAGLSNKKEWLLKAGDNGWTAERLGVEVKKEQLGVEILPVKKNVSLLKDEVSCLITWGKFYLEKNKLTIPLDSQMLDRLYEVKLGLEKYEQSFKK